MSSSVADIDCMILLFYIQLTELTSNLHCIHMLYQLPDKRHQGDMLIYCEAHNYIRQYILFLTLKKHCSFITLPQGILLGHIRRGISMKFDQKILTKLRLKKGSN